MRTWEIEQHQDRLRFQEKRIDDLEKKVQTQGKEVEKQKKQIEGWIKRHLLDPSGKMT